MKRFPAIHMIPAAALGMILSCCACQSAQDLPWYEDTDRLWKDYMAAVEDAKEATVEEMDPDLAAIISPEESPLAEWLERDGRTFVLVGSVMSGEDSRYWESESGTDSGFILDDRLPSGARPHDLTAKLQSAEIQSEDAGIEMRVIQMLGLPPDCGYDRIVFFWAEKDSLFRPAPDKQAHRKQDTAKHKSDSPVFHTLPLSLSKYSRNDDVASALHIELASRGGRGIIAAVHRE